MEEDAYLVVVKDQDGASTDYYRCSLCNAEFHSYPQNPGDMAINFAIHVRHSHWGHKTRIESVSEAATKVVNEAMRKFTK